jgi:hypothetical protein
LTIIQNVMVRGAGNMAAGVLHEKELDDTVFVEVDQPSKKTRDGTRIKKQRGPPQNPTSLRPPNSPIKTLTEFSPSHRTRTRDAQDLLIYTYYRSNRASTRTITKAAYSDSAETYGELTPPSSAWC